MSKSMDAYDRLTMAMGHVEQGLAMLSDEVADLDEEKALGVKVRCFGAHIRRLWFLHSSIQSHAAIVRAAAADLLEANLATAEPASAPVEPAEGQP
jgi:hypothetical protein